MCVCVCVYIFIYISCSIVRLCNIVFVYLYVCSYMCVYISARGENVFDKNVYSDHETVPIDKINIEATIKGYPHF